MRLNQKWIVAMSVAFAATAVSGCFAPTENFYENIELAEREFGIEIERHTTLDCMSDLFRDLLVQYAALDGTQRYEFKSALTAKYKRIVLSDGSISEKTTGDLVTLELHPTSCEGADCHVTPIASKVISGSVKTEGTPPVNLIKKDTVLTLETQFSVDASHRLTYATYHREIYDSTESTDSPALLKGHFKGWVWLVIPKNLYPRNWTCAANKVLLRDLL